MQSGEGGRGCGLVSANFYPFFFSWLVANHEAEPEKAAKLQAFLTVAEGIVKAHYPASAKMFLRTQMGADFLQPTCREPNCAFPTDHPENMMKLVALHDSMTAMCSELGIKPVRFKGCG